MYPRKLISLSALVLALLLAPATVGADGRIELSQVSIDADGGFPVTISQSGSYVLTSNLVVNGDVNGIEIGTDNVAIDLNGFTVQGPSSCATGACSFGTAGGIVKVGNLSENNRATVKNGVVIGFSGNCVFVGAQSNVEDLTISDCGRDGIVTLVQSVVQDSRVRRTGQRGLNLGDRSTFAHNTVAEANLSDSFPGIDFDAVEGGIATAGNSCDDASCLAIPRPRYYLTTDLFQGDHSTIVCVSGFHMASIFELLEPSALVYDTRLGAQTADSGSGPPAPIGGFGWVRTGRDGGLGSCGNTPWSTSNGNSEGAVAQPHTRQTQSNESGWQTQTGTCDVPRPAWCIED